MNAKLNTFLQMGKYGTVTILSYVALLGGTYVCVDLLHLPPTSSYATVLCLVYVGVYFASSRFVFKVAHSRKTMQRFVIAILFLWTLNSGVFYVLETLLHIQYLLAAILNIVMFGLLRFFVHKNWVFQNSTT